jgi:hypothetical protein
LFAVAGKVSKKRKTQVVVISEWKDLGSLKGFTGPNWKKAVVNPKAMTYLKGTPEVEHFEVFETK